MERKRISDQNLSSTYGTLGLAQHADISLELVQSLVDELLQVSDVTNASVKDRILLLLSLVDKLLRLDSLPQPCKQVLTTGELLTKLFALAQSSCSYLSHIAVKCLVGSMGKDGEKGLNSVMDMVLESVSGQKDSMCLLRNVQILRKVLENTVRCKEEGKITKTEDIERIWICTEMLYEMLFGQTEEKEGYYHLAKNEYLKVLSKYLEYSEMLFTQQDSYTKDKDMDTSSKIPDCQGLLYQICFKLTRELTSARGQECLPLYSRRNIVDMLRICLKHYDPNSPENIKENIQDMAVVICSSTETLLADHKGDVEYFGFCARMPHAAESNLRCSKNNTSSRKLILLVIQAAATLSQKVLMSSTKSDPSSPDMEAVKLLVSTSLHRISALSSETHGDDVNWLLDMFLDQDDHLAEALLYLMDCSELLLLADEKEDQLPPFHHPHRLFLTFASAVSFDSSVFLDLVISPETCFLAYLTRYLRFLVLRWKEFLDFCQSSTSSSEDSFSSPTGENTSSVNQLVSYSSSSDSSDSDDGHENKKRKHDTDDNMTLSSSKHPCTLQVKEQSYSSDEQEDLAILKALQTSERKPEGEHVQLDRVMTLFIQLKLKLQKTSGKGLLSFPVTPLIQLLEKCEGLYET